MSPVDDAAYRSRILAQRSATLAARGLGPDRAAGLLAERLVCMAAGSLYAFGHHGVRAVRPYGCQPLPLIAGPAAGVMLGVFLDAGELYSLLDLPRLLGRPDHAPEHGAMLLMRGDGQRVALRVDRVLGLMRLKAADAEGRFGRAADDAEGDPSGPGSLVALVEKGMLRERIAALSRPAA